MRDLSQVEKVGQLSFHFFTFGCVIFKIFSILNDLFVCIFQFDREELFRQRNLAMASLRVVVVLCTGLEVDRAKFPLQMVLHHSWMRSATLR